jgi:hypothetical protein
MAHLLAWLDRFPTWIWAVLFVLQVLIAVGFNDAADTLERAASSVSNADYRKGYYAGASLNRNIALGNGVVAMIFWGQAVRAVLRRPPNKVDRLLLPTDREAHH